MQQAEAVAFDRDEMLGRLGGDAELLSEVLEVFLEECPRMLKEVESAFGDADATLLHRAAHSLKGACLNLSAGPAAAEAKQLEFLAGEKRLAEGAAALQRLQVEIERLQQVLGEQGSA